MRVGVNTLHLIELYNRIEYSANNQKLPCVGYIYCPKSDRMRTPPEPAGPLGLVQCRNKSPESIYSCSESSRFHCEYFIDVDKFFANFRVFYNHWVALGVPSPKVGTPS